MKIIYKKLIDLRKKLLGINGSPRYIAKGFALGSFIGMMPVPGFQMFIALFFSYVFKAHKKAACLAVFNTNLFTGVFIFAFNYWLGKSILGVSSDFVFPEEIGFGFIKIVLAAGKEVFISLLVGGAITGFIVSFVLYYILIQWLTKRQSKNDTGSTGAYTIITGASQGLGKAFAKVCAEQKRDLILISLPDEGIKDFAKELIDRYGIDVHFIETDLTHSQMLTETTSFLKDYQIDLLINNAGIGGTQLFEDASIEYIDSIMLLNMRSLVLLTHQLLPVLKVQKQAYILNISSLAAFSPMPYKTIYPASKTFVYSFSRGLAEELANTNIHVSVAHPGGMATNDEVCKRIQRHGVLVRNSILSTEKTAKICIKQLLEKEFVIIPGKINKLSRLIQLLLPVNWQLRLMRKKIYRELDTDIL